MSDHCLKKVFAAVIFLLEQQHFIFLTDNLLLGAQIVKFIFQVGLLLMCRNALRNDDYHHQSHDFWYLPNLPEVTT